MDSNINYWDEFEYDKLKLLLHKEKVQSIMDVYSRIKRYDNLPPISVELHLTDNCNLTCPWCTDRDLHGDGATITLEKAYELMRTFGQTGTGVTLEGGGEPVIHPQFSDIVDYGYQNNVHLGLITNGTVDISEVLNKFRWVRVSLDASNKEEYIQEKGKDFFERVLENLGKYQPIRDVSKCFLGVGYVLTKRNYHNIEDIVHRLDSLGVDYIYMRPVEEAVDIVPGREELYDLRKEMLRLTDGLRIKFKLVINDRLEYDNAGLPCVAHSLTSIIHANGNVACCEKRRHDHIDLGNIYDQTFLEIWESDAKKRATKKLLSFECQQGCSVCRITPFNKIFNNLNKMNTKEFI